MYTRHGQPHWITAWPPRWAANSLAQHSSTRAPLKNFQGVWFWKTEADFLLCSRTTREICLATWMALPLLPLRTNIQVKIIFISHFLKFFQETHLLWVQLLLCMHWLTQSISSYSKYSRVRICVAVAGLAWNKVCKVLKTGGEKMQQFWKSLTSKFSMWVELYDFWKFSELLKCNINLTSICSI